MEGRRRPSLTDFLRLFRLHERRKVKHFTVILGDSDHEDVGHSRCRRDLVVATLCVARREDESVSWVLVHRGHRGTPETAQIHRSVRALVVFTDTEFSTQIYLSLFKLSVQSLIIPQT